MKFRLLGALALAAAMTPGLAAAQGMDEAKACFIYVGPIGDFGWSYQHDQGRLAVEEAFGGKVTTAYLENVAEGADAERAIERFARSGCNIIFTTSFGFGDATNAVAGKFPDVKFEHATGYKREHPNVTTYDSRFYHGRYVLGRSRRRCRRPAPPAISAPSRSRRWCRASTPSCSVRSRSTRTSR